jgi:hypothetical protein
MSRKEERRRNGQNYRPHIKAKTYQEGYVRRQFNDSTTNGKQSTEFFTRSCNARSSPEYIRPAIYQAIRFWKHLEKAFWNEKEC